MIYRNTGNMFRMIYLNLSGIYLIWCYRNTGNMVSNDTLSGALAIGPESAALNFANAYSHGVGYKRGAQAQEEDP